MSKRKREGYFDDSSDEGSVYCENSESDNADTDQDWSQVDMKQLFARRKVARRKLDFPRPVASKGKERSTKFYGVAASGRDGSRSVHSKENSSRYCNG